MSRYAPPQDSGFALLADLLPARRLAKQTQLSLDGRDQNARPLYYAGNPELLQRPTVAIVGTRKPTKEGVARATRLARELTQAGIVVVSGLAAGVDTAAHTSAIANKGRTIAVIGTPLDRAYPAQNSRLQEEIYRNHLLISPFKPGARISGRNFAFRNTIMAAICDVTVVVEAGETSGTTHQAKACVDKNRWLFFLRSMVDNGPKWPKSFLNTFEMARVLEQTSDVLEVLDAGRSSHVVNEEAVCG